MTPRLAIGYYMMGEEVRCSRVSCFRRIASVWKGRGIKMVVLGKSTTLQDIKCEEGKAKSL